MHTEHVIHWEMYSHGTAVEFQALRGIEGFELLVKRDNDVLLTTRAVDSDTVLRKSRELRGRLQQLGFEPKPAGTRSSHLVGGVCWGPAAPLQSSLVEVLF